MLWSMSFQVPDPPYIGYYDLVFDYSSNNWGDGGVLTCQLCPEGDNKYATDLEPPNTDAAKADLQRWLTRHHRMKHPEKLYVLTSAGWLQVEQLVKKDDTRKVLAEMMTQTVNFLHD